MPIDAAKMFKQHQYEYRKCDLVETKFSQRPDLHAFILLDRLVPATRGIVSAAEQLSEVATEEQIIELTCCGVRYSEDYDRLVMSA